MSELRKITVEVPARSLEVALSLSGLGIAETVRKALDDYGHREASRQLFDMRGTLKNPTDWRILRGKDDDE
jgi:hypothetical protein